MNNNLESCKTLSPLVFFDSNYDITELKNSLEHNPIVISFDHESHDILSKLKIKHIFSETFINENDLNSIQENCYKFSKWFEEPLLQNFLNYNDVNIGELVYHDFYGFLLNSLKNIFEIRKILEKFPENEIICSSNLSEIVKLLKTPKQIQKNDPINIKKSIKIPIKIHNRLFVWNMPYSVYLKSKKISDIIFNNLFGPKKRYDSKKKSVLLVRFSVKRAKKILDSKSAQDLNFFLFDTKSPIIWDYESYSIVKKSNCIVANNDFVKIDNNLLHTQAKQMKMKLDLLWKQEDFFSTFFSLNGFSFWNSIKPKLIQLFEEKYFDAIQKIEETKYLFQSIPFSSLLVIGEHEFGIKIAIRIANQLNVPVVNLQHALMFDGSKALKHNLLTGHIPTNLDKYVVWGNLTKEYAKDCKISSEKIYDLGSPMLDDHFSKKSKQSESKNDFVLLATTGPDVWLVKDMTIQQKELYEKSIIDICKIVKKLNKKLIVKSHPSWTDQNLTDLIHKIDPSILVLKRGNIVPLIESCEVLLVVDNSTVILEGQIFGKPVVSISVKKYFDEQQVCKTNSCISTDVENLEDKLNQILSDDLFKQKILERGDLFVKNYVSNPGKGTEFLLEFLKKI